MSIQIPSGSDRTQAVRSSLQTAYDYFLTDAHSELGAIETYQAQLSSILHSQGSPFVVQAKEKVIIVPDLSVDERYNRTVIWQGRKVMFAEALTSFIELYTHLFPASMQIYSFPLKKLTTELVAVFIVDVVSLINALEKKSRKRAPKTTWKCNVAGEIIDHELPQSKAVEQVSQKDLFDAMNETPIVATDIANIQTIDDIIFLINKSKIPLFISTTQHLIKVNSISVKKLKDFGHPSDYMTIDPTNEKIYPLGAAMKSCAQRWPKCFADYLLLCDNAKGDADATAKLYKAFFEGLVKLYIAKKQVALRLVDGNNGELPWIGHIDFKSSKASITTPIVEVDEKAKHVHAQAIKHKIPFDDQTAQKLVRPDVFVTLGYDKAYSTKLYNFCNKQIMEGRENFTVSELAIARAMLDHWKITQFYNDNSTKYLIRSIDRIFDHYLIDKNTGHKEWSKKGHV